MNEISRRNQWRDYKDDMKTYRVSYERYIVIDAKDEDEAIIKASEQPDTEWEENDDFEVQEE